MTNLSGTNWNSSAGPKGGGQDARNKKRSLQIVNEHFETLFNIAMAKKSLRAEVSMGCVVLRDNRAFASLQDD